MDELALAVINIEFGGGWKKSVELVQVSMDVEGLKSNLRK